MDMQLSPHIHAPWEPTYPLVVVYVSGVDVRGLTAATERWSAAKPAADGAFRTPSQVCEFVMLPGVTGESRDRLSRGLHVLIAKP
jgi:hypothetical protein